VPGEEVGGAVYRIVQESLTNVIRHAGPTSVHVSLAYDDSTLVVRVIDAGGTAAPADGAVHEHARYGIDGMRERCRLLGGDLDAGPLPDGGFQVTARLPLAPAEARA
jgi:signal transduction histidine kinase